jgi:hypothetical protein
MGFCRPPVGDRRHRLAPPRGGEFQEPVPVHAVPEGEADVALACHLGVEAIVDVGSDEAGEQVGERGPVPAFDGRREPLSTASAG